jgi:hypothetical protein
MSETPKKKAPAKKAPAKKATPAKRGRPPKAVAPKPEITTTDSIEESPKVVEPTLAQKKDPVVVRANDVKKASLRKRMLKWFKK